MQEPSEHLPPSHFAGLLATLAGAAPRRDSASWVDEALEDDVAVLSYEQALRAQARHRTDTNPGFPSTASPTSAIPAPEAPPARNDTFAGAALPCVEPVKESLYQQSLKRASVTIRMSEAESAQLHQRAAEAGMTVSAYLRSCAFEVESLRHLVKETMAQLKLAHARTEHSPATVQHPNWRQRLAHWLTPWRETGHPVGA